MASVSLVAMKRLNRQRFPGEEVNRAAFVRATLEKREATFMGRSNCGFRPLVGLSHSFEGGRDGGCFLFESGVSKAGG